MEYISYKMTLDCKKKLKCNKKKLYFSSNHKTGGSLYGKTNTQ